MACVSNKRLAYFHQVKDSTFSSTSYTPTIKKGDILYIAITGADPLNAAIFNSVNSIMPIGGGLNIMNNTSTPGVLVPEDGNIQLPKIGEIKAIGKTTQVLGLEIQNALLNYVKDPLVTVRYMNFRVSVLGEVNKPGTFIINNERITILDALAQAGDLTVFGKRDNVLLLRDDNGIQKLKRINLKEKTLLESPEFYLQSNDVVYVEPNKAKGYSGTNTAVLLPVAISSITLMLLIINQFK
jgi:polysaccharide export outer membrane protein